MIKVFVREAHHPETLHDGNGASVRGNRECDDLLEPEAPKSAVESCVSGLGGVAMFPVVEGETPADFHAGSEMGRERRNGKSDEPCEIGHADHFDCPEPEPVLLEMRRDRGRLPAALLRRQNRGEMLHDAGIGIQRGKVRQILRPPWTQAQAFRGQADRLLRSGHGGHTRSPTARISSSPLLFVTTPSRSL